MGSYNLRSPEKSLNDAFSRLEDIGEVNNPSVRFRTLVACLKISYRPKLKNVGNRFILPENGRNSVTQHLRMKFLVIDPYLSRSLSLHIRTSQNRLKAKHLLVFVIVNLDPVRMHHNWLHQTMKIPRFFCENCGVGGRVESSEGESRGLVLHHVVVHHGHGEHNT